MPTIAQFYGISIRMFVKDHPPPHFHASYGEAEAIISITDFSVIEGKLPRRALRLVAEWATEHQTALEHNWRLAESGALPEKIGGLDADEGD